MLIEHTGVCQHCVKEFTIMVNNGEALEVCAQCGKVPFTANRLAGIVYVVSNPHQVGVKIGMTEKPIEQRIRSLSSTGVPGNFQPIAIFPSKRPRADETRVHEKLRRHRIEKEHFDLDPIEAALGAYRALNRRKPVFFDKCFEEMFYLRLEQARIQMKLALKGDLGKGSVRA
jgi:hypothetical protein